MKFAKCTDLRRNLAELLDSVEGGEEVVLTRRGQPVARLVPIEAAPAARPSWKRPVRARSIRGESIVASIRRERDAS